MCGQQRTLLAVLKTIQDGWLAAWLQPHYLCRTVIVCSFVVTEQQQQQEEQHRLRYCHQQVYLSSATTQETQTEWVELDLTSAVCSSQRTRYYVHFLVIWRFFFSAGLSFFLFLCCLHPHLRCLCLCQLGVRLIALPQTKLPRSCREMSKNYLWKFKAAHKRLSLRNVKCGWSVKLM